MNSHIDVFSLIPLVYLVVPLVLAWFALDMRSIFKWSQRMNQLSIEGRWGELEQHFKSASKTCRPFVWFHRHYLLPGHDTGQYALFLFQQGRLEESLVKVDQAIRQIERKPRIFAGIYRKATFNILCSFYRTRTLILTGLGRYAEARAADAHLLEFSGPNTGPNPAIALLENYCGHFDEALALAQAVPPEDKQYDTMRNVIASVYCAKGEFDQALQALNYQPSDISKFYSHAGFEKVSSNPEGPKLIELQRQRLAGVLQPARLLRLANVFLTQEKFEEANRALDQAEKVLGPEPGLQASYCRHRACSFALQQKSAEAESYLVRMREIVKKVPRRSSLCETHWAAGKSYFYLGRYTQALAELNAAQRFVLHPIEKHATAYWLARSHEAAGELPEAVRYYQAVAADAIPSWMRKQSAEALDRLKS